MTNSEVLKLFCGTDVLRPNLHQPFRQGKWVYATDGHCMIRMLAAGMPEVPVIPNRGDPPPKASMLDPHMDFDVPADQWVPLPPVPPMVMVKCQSCNGCGKVDICDECEGTGTVHWTSEYDNHYEAECEGCDGKGYDPGSEDPCMECDGTGLEESASGPQYLVVGKWKLPIEQARKLAQLQGVHLAVVNKDCNSDLHPLQFTSIEGSGVWMPSEGKDMP